MKKRWWSWDEGLDIRLDEEELHHSLWDRRHVEADGIFGRISVDRFLADLQKLGLLDRLRRRGYSQFSVQVENEEEFAQRVRLWAEHPDRPAPQQLIDVRSHPGALEAPWGRSYRVLGWDWLEMQDPMARPSPFRPLFPGQDHPGLGLFRALTRLMMDYVNELDVEALAAVPQYFHNAVLYGTHFRFLSARMQGEFEALCRDLLDLGVAALSWAVVQERVQMEDRVRGKSEIFAWKNEKIVRPLGHWPEFEDEAYHGVRQETATALRFSLREGSE